MNLSLRAPTGAVCRVQFTPILNPAQWQTLTNGTADANGNVIFIDPSSKTLPSLYYRAVAP